MRVNNINKNPGRNFLAGFKFGLFAEKATMLFLWIKGYKIIAWRYKNNLGEIDIIALKGKFIVFIEVKARKIRCLKHIPKPLETRTKSCFGMSGDAATRGRRLFGEKKIILESKGFRYISGKNFCDDNPENFGEVLRANQAMRIKAAAELFIAKNPAFVSYFRRFDLILFSGPFSILHKKAYF